MRNLTVKARIALANIDENQARRRALEGKRNSITFYGGWYAIDNVSGRCRQATTMGKALDLAEAANL